MKKLDLNEFYQIKLTPEEKARLPHNGRLGATGIITPSQEIYVYAVPKLDDNGNFVDGLGLHEETVYRIICNIFGLPTPFTRKDAREKAESVLKNGSLNYIEIKFTNMIKEDDDENTKFVGVSVPDKISFSQYESLCRLAEKLATLGVPAYASLNHFNPITGQMRPGDRRGLSLDEFLVAILDQDVVLPKTEDIHLLDAKYVEKDFTGYDFDFSKYSGISKK